MNIKLDYDKKWSKVQRELRNHIWLLKKLNVNSILVWKTKKGYHVEAIIPGSYDQKDILLFQVLLGSDRNREILNTLRSLRLNDSMNFLFDRKIFFHGKNVTYRTRKRKRGLETWLIRKILNE